MMKSHEFEGIYKRGGWDNMGSGPGSTPAFTAGYRQYLAQFLKDRGVKSVLDIGCGDWQFSRLVDWKNVRYLGVDVVKPVIKTNRKEFGAGRRIFLERNFRDLGDTFAEYGLILVKDLLHHLDWEDSDWLVKALKTCRTLWTADVHDTKWTVLKVSQEGVDFFKTLPVVYEFDRTVENYRYGPKVTFLNDP